MYLIDTHAHIYLPEFNEDREELLKKAKESSVQRILMPAIDAGTHEAMIATEGLFSFCSAMMGVHPCSVNADFEKELMEAESWLKKRPFVAIGEIGLDLYWDQTFREQQLEAFHRQIGWALQYGLPIVIHSRNATDECIEVIRQYPGLRGVFHCFSGTFEQAVKVVDAGFMMGIGGVVTFKNAGLDKVIERTGLEAVILETDAPYLAPVPFRGKRNEPAYTRLVAEKLSGLTGLPIEEIARITTENAKKLFNL